MADIINIADRRKKPAMDEKWVFDLSIWTGASGDVARITDFDPEDGLEPAERLRKFAATLDYLSYLLLQQAEDMQPSRQGDPLVKVTLFEGSAVRVRLNDAKIVTDEQADWVDGQLDEAKALARTLMHVPA